MNTFPIVMKNYFIGEMLFCYVNDLNSYLLCPGQHVLSVYVHIRCCYESYEELYHCWYYVVAMLMILIHHCCILCFKYRLATGLSRRGFMCEWSMCSHRGALRSLGWGRWRMTSLRLRQRQRVRSSAPRGNRRVPNQVSWLQVLGWKQSLPFHMMLSMISRVVIRPYFIWLCLVLFCRHGLVFQCVWLSNYFVVRHFEYKYNFV